MNNLIRKVKSFKNKTYTVIRFKGDTFGLEKDILDVAKAYYAIYSKKRFALGLLWIENNNYEIILDTDLSEYNKMSLEELGYDCYTKDVTFSLGDYIELLLVYRLFTFIFPIIRIKRKNLPNPVLCYKIKSIWNLTVRNQKVK